MGKKILLLFFILLALAVPAVSLAGDPFGTPPAIQTDPLNANYISTFLGKILDLLWIVFIAFAVIMFIVAGFYFLAAQGEPEAAGKARKALLWGVIGVAVAVAAFSIPFFIRNTISPAPSQNQGGGGGVDAGGGGGGNLGP